MKVSAFTLIRNEAMWVGFHVLSMKDVVSEFVYYDGNSTDGTLEILDYLKKHYGINIKVFKGMDPKDLKDDYVRMFDECLKWCEGDYAAFLHPDMILVGSPNPNVWKSGPFAFSVQMSSFGGEPGEWPQAIVTGRTDKWKNVMRNAYGLHYHGWYGAGNEDMYFRELTGDEHHLYQSMDSYPYDVVDSGMHLFHYSDVRPYSRRLNRMVTCLLNQHPGMDRAWAADAAKNHPRVHLQSGPSPFGVFKFAPAPFVPGVFTKHAAEFASVVGKSVEDFCPIALQQDREVAQ